jgi:hypothetical protein
MTPGIALQTAATSATIAPGYISPLSLSAPCLAWFDMRVPINYTAAGGAISALTDLSGNGNNLVEATGSAQPALVPSNLTAYGANVPAIVTDNAHSTHLLGPLATNCAFGWKVPFTAWMIVSGKISSGILTNPGILLNTFANFSSSFNGWALCMNSYYNGTHDTFVPLFELIAGSAGILSVQAEGTDMTLSTSNFLVRVTYSGATGTPSDVAIYINEVAQTLTVVTNTLGGEFGIPAAQGLNIGSNVIYQGGGINPLLAGGCYSGVINGPDAILLHTYAQQQLNCA